MRPRGRAARISACAALLALVFSTVSLADEALRARVEALAVEPRIDGVAVADPWFLIRFYERRQFSPAWESRAKRDALLRALERSVEHGLDPDDYHVGLLRAHAAETNGEDPKAAAIHFELLASDALARFAFHLRFGKVNPEALEPSWNFSRTLEGTDPVAVFQRLIDAADIAAEVEALAPQEPRYAELKAALAAYRGIERAGGWPELEGGPTLKPGMRDARVARLRERLRIEGYAADAGSDPLLFDEALDAAVQTFQRLHGLDADGAVGPRTIAALNVPVAARIDQLRVNLERLRWIFRDLEERYIIANIARFQVSLIEHGEPVWTTRAVVGRPYRQTPTFRAQMTYLVLNPTWTVPPGILRSDLLPELRRDPEALARRNMVVLDTSGRVVDPSAVDWNAPQFPYMLRQEPGPDNALGRVKFMFPNPHHVYMHDTPSRELFARADRTFSSGCIRLEHPLELAELLLAETGRWDRAAIDAALATGQPRTIALPRPLTVLLIYATAVPENGELFLLPDVYTRDARVLAALEAPFEFVPPAGYEEALSAGAP
ncbi:MAG TPA: L,D-transpeptidase family protein [Gammaproteobacteria bacterium]